jgi:cellobiose PTS system EIIC component
MSVGRVPRNVGIEQVIKIEKEKIEGRVVSFFSRVQKNTYLRAIQEGLELNIPLLIVGSILLVFLNIPILSYQQWMRGVLSLNDVVITQYISAMWVIICIGFVMGISYTLTEALSKNSMGGLTRYQSFLSMSVALTSYLVSVVSSSNGSLRTSTEIGRFPADILVAVFTALVATKLFVVLSNIPLLHRKMGGDISNPVLSRVYMSSIPAMITLSFFVGLRIFGDFVGLNIFDGIVQGLYDNFQEKIPPASLLQAIDHVLKKNLYLMVGVDSMIFLNSMEMNALAIAEPILYDLNYAKLAQNIFSNSFFMHFVYLGGEGALLSLIVAYWVLRVRTDEEKTLRFATWPTLFNVNALLLYGFPILFNPLFLLPFILTPIILTITGYLAFYFDLVPIISTKVSWYMPIGISGYQTTGSWAGVVLQLVNVGVGALVYAPFLVLNRKIRDQDYRQGHKELVEFSMSRYTVEENYLSIRTDVVGSAARILSADLRAALKTDQIFLMYQPKVNLLEGTVMGVEALVRWKHPVYGFIPPPVIVSMAEESDLLNELSHRVISDCVAQIALWKKQGLENVHVGVNLSAKEMNNPALADFILQTVTFHDVDPSQLEIEIVETIELTVNDFVKQQIARIGEMGISLAIDDFGVGHGSAIYLKNFDIQTLKIDKAISEEAHRDHRVAAIFNGVVNICHDLNVAMVIEHVETEEQLEYLVQRGGSLFQGYFFSKPLLPDDLFSYMTSIAGDKSILTRLLLSDSLRNHVMDYRNGVL